jgi:hypothetical protein
MLHLATVHFDFAAILSALTHLGHFMHTMSTGMASGG